MSSARLGIAAALLLALPLVQGCCCCCNGCPGGGDDWGDDWSDEFSEALAEEALEELAGVEIDADEDGGTITLEAEDGSMSFVAGDAATYPEDMPLPQYPGSDVEGGLGFAGGGDAMSAVVLRTDDALDAVSGWYAEQLGPDVQKLEMSDGEQQVHSFTKQLDGGRALMVAIAEEDGRRVITLTSMTGATP